jgi:hypothetical protein
VSLPVELLAKVASNLDKEDIMNFRLTNRMFSAVRASWFWDMLITSKTIYGRFASMAHFLGLLQEFSEYELGSRVECLSLVSEGLRFHEYGPEWAWERMALEDNINITSDDEAVIDKINYDHATEITTNGAFLTGGGFRSTLIGIIAACPNLKAINVRKLKVSLSQSTMTCVYFLTLSTARRAYPRLDRHRRVQAAFVLPSRPEPEEHLLRQLAVRHRPPPRHQVR